MTVEQVDAGEPVNNPDEQPTQVVAAIDPDESQTSSEQDEDDSDDTDDNASTTSGSDSSATKEETPDEDDHKGLLRRTAVGLTALSLGLGLGIGPAQATQSPKKEASPIRLKMIQLKMMLILCHQKPFRSLSMPNLIALLMR